MVKKKYPKPLCTSPLNKQGWLGVYAGKKEKPKSQDSGLIIRQRAEDAIRERLSRGAALSTGIGDHVSIGGHTIGFTICCIVSLGVQAGS